MDGEWPIVLQAAEPEPTEEEQYQAARGHETVRYQLPGGRKLHQKRTRRIYDALVKRFGGKS